MQTHGSERREVVSTYLAVKSGRKPLASGTSYCFLGHPDPSSPWLVVVPDSAVGPLVPVPRSSVRWLTVGASWRLGGIGGIVGER